MASLKERLDALSDEELRLRVRTLIEQCEKEEHGWPAVKAMRADLEDDCGFPSLAYLACVEIYALLGIGPGPSYSALEEAIKRDSH